MISLKDRSNDVFDITFSSNSKRLSNLRDLIVFNTAVQMDTKILIEIRRKMYF